MQEDMRLITQGKSISGEIIASARSWGGKALAGAQKFSQAVRAGMGRTIAGKTREGRCPGLKGTEDHGEGCELGLLEGLKLISKITETETERVPEKSLQLPAKDAGDVKSGETHLVSRLKGRICLPMLQFP